MKLKKVISILLSALMLMSVASFATGCKKGRQVDKTKTQLHIGVYNGGLGYAWTEDIARKFEEYYKNRSFEDGKTGVQVWIEGKKTEFERGQLIERLRSPIGANDIYYTVEGNIHEFLSAGVLEVDKMNEAVTANVYDANGKLSYDANGKPNGVSSIADKMDPAVKERYLSFGDGAGARVFPGVPYENSLMGFVYDRDLFEYYDWIADKPGPSGIDDPNAYDYGLPATMDEFKTLFNHMEREGVIPWTFTGGYNFYAEIPLGALQVQYNGIEQSNLSSTYNGMLTTAVNSDWNVQITPQNGWRLADQKGRLKALEFYRFISSKGTYYHRNTFTQWDHLTAQETFVYSRKMSEISSSHQPIAMIIEGEWWENEARNSFNEMEARYPNQGYGFGERDFRFLPFPRLDEEQAIQGSVFTALNPGTLAFINGKIEDYKKDLAALWFQFALTEESLQTFTVYTGAKQAYNYSLTAAQYNSLTPFGKSVWDMKTSPNGPVIHTPAAPGNYAKYGEMTIGMQGKRDENTYYGSAIMAFGQNESMTAQDYFGYIKNRYNQAAWENSYNSFVQKYPGLV